jgi:CrcB protein
VTGRRVLAVVAAGGAVGTLARAGLAEALPHDPDSWPWATFIVNVAGALVLGIVARRLGGTTSYAFLGAGLCGAMTTFSTLQLELYDLIDGGHAALAAAYAAATIAGGLGAVVAGDRIGQHR